MANIPTIELQLQELEQEITRNCLELRALNDSESPISYWRQAVNLATNQEFLYKLRIAMLSAQTTGFHNTTIGKLMLGDLENVTKNKEVITKHLQLVKEQMERDGRLSGAVLASHNFMKLVDDPTQSKDDESEGDSEYYNVVSRHSDQEDWEVLDSASQASEKWEERDFDGVSDSEGSFTLSSASNPYESKTFDSKDSDSSDNDTASSVSNPYETDDSYFEDSELELDMTRLALGYEADKGEEFDNDSEDNTSEWESSVSSSVSSLIDDEDNASEWESSTSSDNERNWSTQTRNSRTSNHQNPILNTTNNNNNNTNNTALIDRLVSLSVKPKPNWPRFINPEQHCSTSNPMYPFTRTQTSAQTGTREVVAPTYNIDDVLRRNAEYLSCMQREWGGEWRGKLGKRDRKGRLILERQLKDMEEVVVGRGGGGAWFDGRL